MPAARLLVFDVREGWPPLCAFLGVPVPDAPFPRVNDADEIRRISRLLSATAWLLLLGAGATATAGAARVARALAARARAGRRRT